LRQIAGFLPTIRGEIRLGNIQLDALSWSQLRQMMAYVPQQPVIFTGTIASNMRCAAANASDELVAAVARLALLGPLLDRSTGGIYQSVGLDGAALSGGEAQRLSIARALLQATPILLLDEATSALDEESERQLVQNLRQLPVTLVLVTHRQTEIWRADQVLDLSAAAQH
jgi:ABC-type bacteriocin/lantibiotic exporter with double-glycine peptidase domain